MTKTSPDHPVLDALEKQVGCYRRLAKLAELQHEHVQHGQTEGLIEVLEKRGEVLQEVSGLESVVGPAKKRWSSFVTELASDRRAAAEHLLAETRSLLEQITTADRNDVLVLQQRQLTLGRQINQASAARTVNRSYAAAAYGRKASSVDLSR